MNYFLVSVPLYLGFLFLLLNIGDKTSIINKRNFLDFYEGLLLLSFEGNSINKINIQDKDS